MKIGQLAKAVGVNPSTIRYYEQIGLLQPAHRTASGYREYTDADGRRLRLVVQARMLSVPLAEVRDFVDLAVEGRCNLARTELLSTLHRRLAETRRQIGELRSLQRELEDMCAHLTVEVPATDNEADACTCLDAPESSHPAERESQDRDDRKEDRT